jgi:hypothetical protein
MGLGEIWTMEEIKNLMVDLVKELEAINKGLDGVILELSSIRHILSEKEVK